MSHELRKQLDRLRARLGSGPLYRYLRKIPAARQRAKFRDLVARANALPLDLDLDGWLRKQLAERAPLRKALPSRLADATIVGVGARGWERRGLWPSLARLSDFHLFSDGLADDVAYHCNSAAERDGRNLRLLDFVADIERTRPVHIVFIYAHSRNLSPSLMQQLHDRGCWTVLMGLDDKHTFLRERVGDLDVGVETIAPSVDLYWTTWRTGRLVHYAIGSRAWLGGFGADPAFYHPFPVEKDIDVLFLGAAYGVRREIIDAIRSCGVRIESAGSGWESGFVSFDTIVRHFSRARVVLGVSNVGSMDDVTIIKGRDFEVPMCGACYLTQYVDELTDFFAIGRDILCYQTASQAADTLASLLRDEPRRRELAKNALQRSLDHNTWEHRIKAMYAVLTRGS